MEEEVKLYRNTRERERLDNAAEMYSILLTLQYLEKAYIQDSISAKEYTDACSKLLFQFNATSKLIDTELKAFVELYRVSAPAALHRISEGKPETVRHKSSAKNVADVVSLFITLTDKLRLEIKAKDEIQPDLKELLHALSRIDFPSTTTSFQSNNLILWLTRLDEMAVSQELSAEQVRQLLFDLDSSYNDFNKILHAL